MSKRVTTEEFIKRAREVHGDKYDYSKVEYIGRDKNVCIICPIHGEFWQTPANHLCGKGCKQCGYEKIRKKLALTYDEFEQMAAKVHNGIYSYHHDYINGDTLVTITCPKHGNFTQIAKNHLKGHGCNACATEKKSLGRRLPNEFFLKRAKEIFGDRYTYKDLTYKNVDDTIEIICPKHGVFTKTVYKHLHGQGCQKCQHFYSLEIDIESFLKEKSIEYESQKHFKWLKQQSLDFYIPSKNIAIECQGKQHFESVEHFGGENGLKITIERDDRKRKLCEEHGIKILYYSNLGIDYPYHVFEDKEELLKEILK